MDLPDGSMRAVLAYCDGLPVETFEAGAVLIPEGPSTDLMFILVEGEVEVLRGDTQVAEIHDAGAVFGEMAALLGTGHSATVKAITAVKAHRIAEARSFLRGNTDIMFHVGRIMAQRLVDATIYLADFKRQFADRSDHFALVDEVLDTLVQRQRPAVSAGSNLKSDPRLRG